MNTNSLLNYNYICSIGADGIHAGANSHKLKLPEEPPCADCKTVSIAGKLQAQSRGELLGEVIISRQLEVGIAVVQVDVVYRATNLELRRY